MEMPSEYIIAQGPEGLEKVLNDLLDKVHANTLLSETTFILYQLNNQKSLIKVNTQQIPFRFWHYDLMGRPATVAIKDTLAEFLWEKCGVKEMYFQETNK